MVRQKVEIGEIVHEHLMFDSTAPSRETYEGKVIYIHPKGRFFRAEFQLPGGVVLEEILGSKERRRSMTLVDLHNALGDELEKVKDSDKLPKETQRKVIDSAAVFSSLAKQMINNADVILRAQKLVYDKKMPKTAAIALMIDDGVNNAAEITG